MVPRDDQDRCDGMDLGVVILIVGTVACVYALWRDDRDPGSGDYGGWDGDGDD